MTHTHRSRYAVVSMSLIATVAMMLVAAGVLYLAGELPVWGWAIVGVIWSGLVARATRVRLVTDDNSVVVVNFFRTVKIPRKDVVGVRSSEFLLMPEPLLALETKSQAVRITASMSVTPRGRAQVLAAISREGVPPADDSVGIYEGAGLIQSFARHRRRVIVLASFVGGAVGWAANSWSGAIFVGSVTALVLWGALQLMIRDGPS
jgi:hypothetical protein